MGPEVSLVGGTLFKNQPKPAAHLGGTRKHWGLCTAEGLFCKDFPSVVHWYVCVSRIVM